MTSGHSSANPTGRLYFVTVAVTEPGTVSVIAADGSQETVLCRGKTVIEPDGIEVDLVGGKMYWTDMGLGGAADKSVAVNDGRILRADLDGSNIETLVTVGKTSTPKQIALDIGGGKVYWSDRGDVGDQRVNPKIMRCNLDGSGVETLVSSDLLSPVGIALDTAAGKIYFTDRYGNDIKRANLDGTDVEVVVRGTEYPVDLALDLEHRVMYWTARTTGCVYRTGMDGTEMDGAGLAPILTGLHTPIGIALDLDGGRLFVAEPNPAESSGIRIADLDGSHARRITTSRGPLGICFAP